MAKSVPVTPLSGIGSNPAVLDGLVPSNPLINTLGGLIAAIFALRATPATVAVRWPKEGDGTTRRVYLLGTPDADELGELGGTLNTEFSAPMVTLVAENTPLSAKALSQTGVVVDAGLSGASLGTSGSLLRQIQETLLMPSVPKLTASQLANKLDDLFLVNKEVPHLLLVSQYSSAVKIWDSDDMTQTAVEDALALGSGGIVSVASMENYTPPSSGPDRHFWEPGSDL